MRKYPISIAAIARKWSRAIERGKGIRFEADEMDLLNAVGAGELIAREAAEEQREVAVRRQQERAERAAGATEVSSLGARRDAPPSGRSPEDALRRARRGIKPRTG